MPSSTARSVFTLIVSETALAYHNYLRNFCLMPAVLKMFISALLDVYYPAKAIDTSSLLWIGLPAGWKRHLYKTLYAAETITSAFINTWFTRFRHAHWGCNRMSNSLRRFFSDASLCCWEPDTWDCLSSASQWSRWKFSLPTKGFNYDQSKSKSFIGSPPVIFLVL